MSRDGRSDGRDPSSHADRDLTDRKPSTATWPTCLTNRSPQNRRSQAQCQDRVQITTVTHLTEDGADRRFVQEQAGHRYEASTAIYTHVGGDFMNTMLRRALAPALDPATRASGGKDS